MRKIKLEVDLYTKFVLTLIAIGIFGILLKPLILPEKAISQGISPQFLPSTVTIENILPNAKLNVEVINKRPISMELKNVKPLDVEVKNTSPIKVSLPK